MTKEDITNYLTDALSVGDSEAVRKAVQFALLALDVKTVKEILSKLNVTGLEAAIQEAYRCISITYKTALEQSEPEGYLRNPSGEFEAKYKHKFNKN